MSALREMPVQTKTAVVFVAAAALRLAVYQLLPNVVAVLSDRVEVATPISSYKRLQEGLFLFERNVSPYDGGVFHQAPLLLVVFEFASPAVIFTGLDLLNAYNVFTIAQQLSLPSPRFRQLDPSQIAAVYLFNPFSILSCLGSSTTNFTSAAVLQAIASAATGNAFGAMFATAVGTYLSLYPALLLPPIIQYWSKTSNTILRFSTVGSLLGIYLCNIALLLLASALLIGNGVDGFKDFLVSCYGAQITVTDLTPNVGLWWYFFIEIFDPFRNFFIGVFWIHLVGYVGALTLRLPEQPLFVFIALTGLIAIFKPYPSTTDVSLYLGVLPLYAHIIPLTRYTFVAASILLYSTLLGPAFYHIWIYAGSGNANFFYAITLVWSLGLSMLVGDSLFAVLRDEWEMVRPEMRGKEVRQI